MKLKTRIILGFTMIILMPLLLFAATLYGFSQSQKTQVQTESDGTVYDISIIDSADSQGRVHVMAKDLFISAFIILISVALVVGLWVYRSIAVPLVKLKKATQNIKEGNLDFVLDVEGNDEFSELCQDFEEMRRRLKESTEEKNLIEKENKELISNISHDLKTPITAVKGYIEGIMDGVADTPEKMDRYVRTIYNKTNEMDHLINELTFYSKIDTNRIPYTFSKLNVEDYFADCAEEVGLELETRGIELVYANYVEKDVMVIADGEQIRRVIHNIISNAIKYTPEGHSIYVEVHEAVSENPSKIRYIFSCEDTGIGMSEEYLPHVYEEFSREHTTTENKVQGTGLGLSIIKSMIELMDGSIQVESRQGIGTKFTIDLYFDIALKEEVYGSEDTIESSAIHTIKGKRILLVEDNELNAEIAKTVLEDVGALITRVEDGQQAVKLFKEKPAGTFDAILMDLMMPVMDGYTATKKIRSLEHSDAKTIPIIAMTANAFQEDAEKCIAVGMNAHLAKPLNIEKMMTTICHLVKKKNE